MTPQDAGSMPNNGTAFRIDKNVPIPPKHRSTIGYPFREMEVGDSFEVTEIKRKNLDGTMSYHGRVLGRKFISRRMAGGAFRIWRTA